MSRSRLSVYNADETAQLLPYADLVEAIATAARDLNAGLITAPARQAVNYAKDGVMLSMPATAPDMGVHKLVNVVASNKTRHLATINGIVSVYDGITGEPRLVLDGPTVTIRRTAAVSMLGIRLLKPQGVKHALIIGSGTQTHGHAEALRALYPRADISIMGRSEDKSHRFVEAWPDLHLSVASEIEDDVDVVITTTTSASPVYNQEARSDRLIVGVGAYRHDLVEIGTTTVASSKLYVDELEGSKHEAGDYIQADVRWDRVSELIDMLNGEVTSEAAIYKTVGCAAWDLAAARCAMAHAQ